MAEEKPSLGHRLHEERPWAGEIIYEDEGADGYCPEAEDYEFDFFGLVDPVSFAGFVDDFDDGEWFFYFRFREEISLCDGGW